MTVHTHIYEAPVGRHFGFDWELSAEIYHLTYDDFTEFYFVTDPSAFGGSYFIYHIPDGEYEGLWDLMEAGGRGPDVWDREIGFYESPSEAMHAARFHYNAHTEILTRMETEIDELASGLDTDSS